MNRVGEIVKVSGAAVLAAAIGGLVWWTVSPPASTHLHKAATRDDAEARRPAAGLSRTDRESHDTSDTAYETVPGTDPDAFHDTRGDAGAFRGDRDFERAIRAALEIENLESREEELDDLLAAWAERNPVAAANFCVALDAPARVRDDLLRRVLHYWTVDGSSDAVLWAEALTGPEERDAALRHAFLGVSRVDPEAAVQLAQIAYPGARTADVMADLAMAWARRDLPSAYEWAVNEPDGIERDAVMARLTFVLSQVDPALAARLVEEEIPQGRARGEAILSVLHQWSLSDIEAALEWVDRLPPGELYDRALRELEGSVNFQLERSGNTE